jgi:hypothetical protein
MAELELEIQCGTGHRRDHGNGRDSVRESGSGEKDRGSKDNSVDREGNSKDTEDNRGDLESSRSEQETGRGLCTKIAVTHVKWMAG